MFPNVFGLKGIAIALLVGTAIGGFAGWRTTEAFCEAAELKLKLANMQTKLDAANRDLKASQDAAANSVAAAGVIEQRARDNEERVNDLQAELAKKPVACRGLDADGLRRLLQIAPR